MSAFRVFNDARLKLEAAQKAFERAREGVASFRAESIEKLNSVLTEFARAGLFPRINTFASEHTVNGLEFNTGTALAPERISFWGVKANHLDPASKDTAGCAMAEDIIDAVGAQDIAINRKDNSIYVSERIREREKCPEILLKALAEYADRKSKPELGDIARKAAGDMKTLVSSYQELGRR